MLNDLLPKAVAADKAVAAAKKAKRALTSEEEELVQYVKDIANKVVQVMICFCGTLVVVVTLHFFFVKSDCPVVFKILASQHV